MWSLKYSWVINVLPLCPGVTTSTSETFKIVNTKNFLHLLYSGCEVLDGRRTSRENFREIRIFPSTVLLNLTYFSR